MNNLIKKGVAFTIILLFISVSVIPSTGTNIVKSSTVSFDGNTLYVGGSGPGNYSTIQAAIDDAEDGDTVFVYDDSSPYYENVIVNRSISLIGEGRKTTIINAGGNKDGIYISADDITITELTIINSGDNYQNPDVGIEVQSDYNNIIGNIVQDNLIGIYLYDATKIIISDNHISNNNQIGVYASYSYENIIIRNNFIDNGMNADFEGQFPPEKGNYWRRNYWSDSFWVLNLIIFPKVIWGEGHFNFFSFTLWDINWRPARKPYDIGVG